MKTKNLILVLVNFIIITLSLQAQSVNFEWAKQMGGSGNDNGRSITTDASGNVYTTGIFQATVDFDPGSGVSNFTSSGLSDFYVQKMSATGNMLWTKTIGGIGEDKAYNITTDATGNVYVIGKFQDTVDFNPGTGSTLLQSHGDYDIFILKLDASGNFVWAKNIGDTGPDEGRSVTIDANGFVYATGHFFGQVDFNTGSGINNLSAYGVSDIFILKLNSNGNFIWAKRMGALYTDEGISIKTDKNANVYTFGEFEGVVDFDPGSGTFNLNGSGGSDLFIQKLNTNGDFIWAKKIGIATNESAQAITLDDFGGILLTGSFQGIVDFDPGTSVSTLSSLNGSQDIYVAKMDTNGNFIWAKNFGGSSLDQGNSIVTDPNGNVYSTGYFYGTADFDPGTGTTNLNSPGSYGIYIQKLDSSGNFVWARSMGGSGTDVGISITIDINNNIYSTGQFEGVTDFNPGSGSNNFTSYGQGDIYIQKLSENTTGLNKIFNSITNSIFPNPTNGLVYIQFEENKKLIKVRLLNISGQEIFNKQYTNIDKIQLEINQPKGIYLLETTDELNNKTTQKIIKK